MDAAVVIDPHVAQSPHASVTLNHSRRLTSHHAAGSRFEFTGGKIPEGYHDSIIATGGLRVFSAHGIAAETSNRFSACPFLFLPAA